MQAALKVLSSAIAAMFMSTAAFAQCLESVRTIGQGEGAARIKQLLCKAPGENAPSLRVEFQRLTSSVASVVLEGRSSTHLAAAFGKPAIIQNNVLASFKEILAKVGQEESTANCDGEGECSIRLDIGGGSGVNSADDEGPVRLDNDRVLGNRIVRIEPTGGEYPSGSLNQALKAGNDWPAEWGLSYAMQGEINDPGLPDPHLFTAGPPWNGKPFSVRFWRYPDVGFFANFAAEVQQFNAAVRKKHEGETADYYIIKKADPGVSGYAALGTLPLDFFLLTGEPGFDPCGDTDSPICCWTFRYQRRTAELDVAVIENVTKAPIKVDALLGTSASERTFRATADTAFAVARGSEPIASVPGFALAPGNKVLVPLRILFPPPEGEFTSPDAVAAGKVAHASIMSAPAGTVFHLGTSSKSVQKVRESFRPPTIPEPKTYAYGPEIALSGLAIAGKRIDLKATKPNFIELTAGMEVGSCPFLTAWNAESGRWTELGKVLDKAKSQSLAQSQTIRIDGFRSRFRLTEREPEVSHIDSARLVIQTRDNRSLALEPDEPRLISTDGASATFMWGEAIEFAFRLPRGIAERDVVSSELILTGYYVRYSPLAEGVEISTRATPLP